ncbi:MAG TPA: hemerythrin domain-containing protein [Acidothermaceae bacterium]|nr:hemerythrin domain-containing protein [Acidothermaceae bacterium]
MPEITELILTDHAEMRRAFARLDELRAANASSEELGRCWSDLATLLDVHAAAEEELVYPKLLRRGDNAAEETDDAIRDHNDIRDAVSKAGAESVGTASWWAAVLEARESNSDHMAEEEREPLPDLRLNVALEDREEIGRRWMEYKHAHPTAAGLRRDLDPKRYIEANESAGAAGPS